MFIQSAAWNGLKNEDMTEVYSRIGPSIAFRKQAEKPEQRSPKPQIDITSRIRGRVTYYNKDRGFGKIDSVVGFLLSAVIDGYRPNIESGVRVTYVELVNESNGRRTASQIMPIIQ